MDGEFTDVTLALSDGKQIRGHRAILAASSNFFRKIFRQNSIGNPTVKRVRFFKITLINELGGVIS